MIEEVINKWNNKVYQLMALENGKATLRRSDGTIFVIAQSEYYSNYRPVLSERKK